MFFYPSRVVAVAVLLAVAGCSGGQHSSGSLTPADATGAASKAMVAATPPPDHPLYNGATFRFLGTVSSSLTLNGSTTQSSQQMANTMTTLYPTGYNGSPGYADFHEDVSVISGGRAPFQTFDNYQKFMTQGNGTLFLVTPGNADTTYLTNETKSGSAIYEPAEILDELPHVTSGSANTWTTTPLATYSSLDTVTGNNPTTLHTLSTVDTNGGYIENLESLYSSGSYVEMFATNDDGSGDRTVTYGYQQYPATWEHIGTPTTSCSGLNAQSGASQIPVTTWSNWTGGGASPNGTSPIGPGTTPAAGVAVQTYCIPNWYSASNIPGNTTTAAPYPLYSGTKTDNGTVSPSALPAGCTALIGSSVMALIQAPGAIIDDNHTKTIVVDLWGNGYGGSTVSTTDIHDYFLAGFGEVCDAATLTVTAFGLPQFNINAGAYASSPSSGLKYETQVASAYEGVSAFTLPQNATPLSSAQRRTLSVSGGASGVSAGAAALVERMRAFAASVRYERERSAGLPVGPGALVRAGAERVRQ